MHNEQYCYVLDANAIRMLSFEQIQDAIRKELQVITIDEVYFEVQSLEKAKILSRKHLNIDSYKKMAELLNSSVNVRNIISYYENKGAADVALLAYSLTSNCGRLFGDENIIITNDKGLREACDEFCIKWMSVIDFLNI